MLVSFLRSPSCAAWYCLFRQHTTEGTGRAEEAYEVGAVVDSGRLTVLTTKHLRLPRIQMRVEVDNSNRSVRRLHTSQDGENDGMVTTQRDNPGQRLPILRRPLLIRVRRGLAHKQLIMPALDLPDGKVVVIGSNGDIAAVEDFRPGVERVRVEGDVVSAAEADPA